MPRRASTHKPHPPVRRPSPSARGYGGDWPAVRLRMLRLRPMCEADGCPSPATEVDHVKRHVPGEAHDEANLMCLCKSCHSKKTCAADHGFGRAPKGDR
jgi:5-methylcytosine-specific restriction protein A